jgi:hypothetical protein
VKEDLQPTSLYPGRYIVNAFVDQPKLLKKHTFRRWPILEIIENQGQVAGIL